LNRDFESEIFEATKIVPAEALSVELVEVRGTEVLVGNAALEDVPYRHQGTVSDRKGRLLGTAPPCHSRVEAGEVGTVGARCRPGRLDQGTTEPLVALASLPGFALPGALVVARTQGGPRSEMRRGGETVHLHSDLGDDYLGRSATDPGDGLEQISLLCERAEVLVGTSLSAINVLLIQLIDVGEDLSG
jgi:hypothetical protein